MNTENPWTPDEIAKLRVLWAEGLSGTAIGQRLGGRSGYAVLGARKRYGLPARPSPLKLADPEAQAAVYRRASVTRAANLAAKRAEAAATAAAQGGQDAAAPPDAARSAPPSTDPTAPPEPRSRTCLWPIGEPGARNFRFCDAATVEGKPYCPDHCRTAFLKVRPIGAAA